MPVRCSLGIAVQSAFRLVRLDHAELNFGDPTEPFIHCRIPTAIIIYWNEDYRLRLRLDSAQSTGHDRRSSFGPLPWMFHAMALPKSPTWGRQDNRLR